MDRRSRHPMDRRSRHPMDRRLRHTPVVPPVTKKTSSYAIKIENLSKCTSEAALRGKLVNYASHIKSVHIKDCPTSPANYAYVNCSDLEVAELIVSHMDKKVLLDSNLLTAKLKHGGPHAGYQDGTGYQDGSHASGGRGVCTLKVLIDDGFTVTGQDLDRYFGKYGELSSPCKIRLGNPHYVYVNFRDPVSAQAARNDGQNIRGMKLRIASAASFNPVRDVYKPMTTLPQRLPAYEFVRNEYPCDPLAGPYVKGEVHRHLKEHGWLLKAQVAVQGGNVVLFSEKRTSTLVGDFVRMWICSHEAKIKSAENVLECLYLPILADTSVQKQCATMHSQVPFELKVLAAGSYVPLDGLAQAYSECDEKTVKAEKLARYMQQVKTPPTEFSWYWQDEHAFLPYEASVSRRLEQAFVCKQTVVESIGQFEYKINTSVMKQTNTSTNRSRRIERRTVPATPKWSVTLQIRAHSVHVEEIKGEILELLAKHVQESEVPVPYEESDPDILEHLLEVARLGFVTADEAVGCDQNIIVLKGMLSVVKSMEVQLKDTMLTRRLEAVKTGPGLSAARPPDHWEPQQEKCALKVVRSGTSEWSRVEQRVMEPGFGIRVVRIERIQNNWLWDSYCASRKRLSDKNGGQVNEKELFHGTRGTPPVKIYKSEQGFDNRLSSRGLWGEGAYFAVRAAYSDGYAYTTPEGHKQMFLVKVITGITYKCSPDRSLKAPPVKASSMRTGDSMFEDERYDSVSGHTNGSDVFIIYEHGKVYPAYLVTYKTL